MQQLQLLIDEILTHLPETRLFILVDEIDSVLSLDFPVNDFFAFVRACHEQRQYQSDYERLTWALFGVATPSDLIRDGQRPALGAIANAPPSTLVAPSTCRIFT